MSFLPIGFAECSAIFQIPGSGGPANVVTGHDVSGLATSLAVVDAIQDGWTTTVPLTEPLPSTTILVGLEVRWQAAVGDPVIISRTLNIPGSDISPSAPPQVCILMQKISGFAGRKNRGRMYLPGIGEDQVGADGNITGGWQTLLNTAGAAALSNWGTSGAELVILHTNPADTPRPVVELNPSGRVATQRRRLR